MPLVYQQNINESTRLAVWHITEAEDFFLQKTILPNSITHPNKRLQHLAGRHLLSELFEDFPLELIKIAEAKKPFLANEAFHFSISHAGDYASAIVSKKNRVGVDIEFEGEKIERIKNKFLTAGEHQLLGNIASLIGFKSAQLLILAWSIKEAMFKWYGNGGVDFKQHLRINKIINNGNEFLADCTFQKHDPINLKVHGLFFNDKFLAWIAASNDQQ